MTRALDGMRVVVTRSVDQASTMTDALTEHGAVPIQVPMIAIVEPDDAGAALAVAVADVARYAQVVVSSPNGARAFVTAVGTELGAVPPVACVGPSTAEVITNAGLIVNIVPDRSVAEGLLQAIAPPSDNPQLLLVQAAIARPVLEEGLAALGWNVDRVIGYQTIDAAPSASDLAPIETADAIIFTSSSTVERFVRLVGRERMPPLVVSIGPVTSATARELDVAVDVEADQHTLAGVITSLVAWARSR